jgi:hypothetical protein
MSETSINDAKLIYSTKYLMDAHLCVLMWLIHGGHLGFQDGRQTYKFENGPIDLVDLKNICLHTKIMFLLYFEAQI